jgi:hypothetical protein
MGTGLVSSFVLSGGEGITSLQNDFDNSKNISALRTELKRVGCSPVKMLSPKASDSRIIYIPAGVVLGAKVTLEGQQNIAFPSGRFVCDSFGNIGMVGDGGIVTNPFKNAPLGSKLPNVRDTTGTFPWKSIYLQARGNAEIPQAVITAPERIDDEGNVMPNQLPQNQGASSERQPLMTDITEGNNPL